MFSTSEGSQFDVHRRNIFKHVFINLCSCVTLLGMCAAQGTYSILFRQRQAQVVCNPVLSWLSDGEHCRVSHSRIGIWGVLIIGVSSLRKLEGTLRDLHLHLSLTCNQSDVLPISADTPHSVGVDTPTLHGWNTGMLQRCKYIFVHTIMSGLTCPSYDASTAIYLYIFCVLLISSWLVHMVLVL